MSETTTDTDRCQHCNRPIGDDTPIHADFCRTCAWDLKTWVADR